jgi:hypothetical protein
MSVRSWKWGSHRELASLDWAFQVVFIACHHPSGQYIFSIHQVKEARSSKRMCEVREKTVYFCRSVRT